jgi:hypothetical protein
MGFAYQQSFIEQVARINDFELQMQREIERTEPAKIALQPAQL